MNKKFFLSLLLVGTIFSPLLNASEEVNVNTIERQGPKKFSWKNYLLSFVKPTGYKNNGYLEIPRTTAEAIPYNVSCTIPTLLGAGLGLFATTLHFNYENRTSYLAYAALIGAAGYLGNKIYRFYTKYSSTHHNLQKLLDQLLKQKDMLNILDGGHNASFDHFLPQAKLLYATNPYPVQAIAIRSTTIINLFSNIQELLETILKNHDRLDDATRERLKAFKTYIHNSDSKLRFYIQKIMQSDQYNQEIKKYDDEQRRRLLLATEQGKVEALTAQANAHKEEAIAAKWAALNNMMGNPSIVIKVDDQRENRN